MITSTFGRRLRIITILFCGFLAATTTQGFSISSPLRASSNTISLSSSAINTKTRTGPLFHKIKPSASFGDHDHHHDQSATASNRRDALNTLLLSSSSLLLLSLPLQPPQVANAVREVRAPDLSSGVKIDVNNALAREYTAFPGLFPTIATKIVRGVPYKSKKDVYDQLNELEAERLKQYDKFIVIKKPDAQLKQFKESQICKYECGGRVSTSYRDEQIKAVQRDRNSY